MQRLIAACVVAAVVFTGTLAQAKSLTNAAGVVYTQPLMSEIAANPAAQNATRYAQRVGDQGLLVAKYTLSLGATGSVSLVGCVVPKGAILLENAVVEVSTAVLPADETGTVTITSGGATVLASNTNTLASTGIKAAVASAAVTTSAAAPVVAFSGGATVTSGVFTVYIPYIQGIVWE